MRPIPLSHMRSIVFVSKRSNCYSAICHDVMFLTLVEYGDDLHLIFGKWLRSILRFHSSKLEWDEVRGNKGKEAECNLESWLSEYWNWFVFLVEKIPFQGFFSSQIKARIVVVTQNEDAMDMKKVHNPSPYWLEYKGHFMCVPPRHLRC